MLHVTRERPTRVGRQFSVGLAASEDEVLAAQRLRWQVFAEEMGARLSSGTPGVDIDHYDAHCDHLVVRDEFAGKVVGTYRILSPSAARRAGGYYSENEFDLTRLRHLRPRMVELGRSCIDPGYRSGAVITLLWTGLAQYMRDGGHDTLIGCASIGMGDGGHNAANLYAALGEHMAPLEYRVFPHCRLPVERLATGVPPELPALIKGYLRAGCWVCGAPAWDPDFNTADLFMLMPMARVQTRYARHFVERAR